MLSLTMVNGTNAEKVSKYHARKRGKKLETPSKFNCSEEDTLKAKDNSLERSQGKSQVTKAESNTKNEGAVRIFSQQKHQLYGDFEDSEENPEGIKFSDPLGLRLESRFKSVCISGKSPLARGTIFQPSLTPRHSF